MASFKLLSALVLSTVLVSTLAKSVIDEDALERELQNAEFKDAIINYEDSSEGSTTEVKVRSDSKKKRCGCKSDISCGCCLKPKILGYKFRGCANATMYTNEKLIEVALHFEDKQIAQSNFSFAKAEQICDKLPGKADFLKFCLYTNNTESVETGLVSCTSFDIIVKNTTALIFNFSCIQFKDGQINFDQHQDIGRDSMLTVKFKNPIKILINLLKKDKTA